MNLSLYSLFVEVCECWNVGYIVDTDILYFSSNLVKKNNSSPTFIMSLPRSKHLLYASFPDLPDFSPFFSKRAFISARLSKRCFINLVESVQLEDFLDDTWKKILASPGNMYDTP